MGKKVHAILCRAYYAVPMFSALDGITDPLRGRSMLRNASAAFVYAPSPKYEHLFWGPYGVGHTAWRRPGEMRGTVVGKKGRWRFEVPIREEVIFTT
jgi:hypothetical protein